MSPIWLADGWDSLTTVLAEAEAAGHNAATVLDQALGQRTVNDAHSPAGTSVNVRIWGAYPCMRRP